ncbi:MAG: type II and III secretion system protein [Chloroherpetonaceae bacterium]|nr:type II and III secretion system protein [Chthonomonadaceae bacterium]MDW8208598.1 type II and III secretion system protein [Chloroherpetonaceae bacterium]
MMLRWRTGRLVCTSVGVVLGAAWLFGGEASAHASEAGRGQSSAGAAYIEQLELTDAPLVTAIKLIKQKTGINLVFINQGQQYGTVTLSVRQKPVEEVLRLMAQSAGADLWEENGIFFIGPQGSAPRQTKPEPALPEPDPTPSLNYPTRWEKIKLNYISPQQLLRYLGIKGSPIQSLDEIVTVNAMKMLLNAQNELYRPVNVGPSVQIQGFGNPVIPVAPGAPLANPAQTADPIRNLSGTQNVPVNLNGAGSSDQNARRDGSEDLREFGRGGQAIPGGGFGGFGQPPGGFGPGGQGGGQGGQFGQGGFGGQFGQGGFGFGGIGAASGLLPDGINPGDIFAYDATGDIIVRVTGAQGEQALRDLRQVIQLLDVKPQQILVRAEFITVTQNDVSSFGINWNFQRVNLVGGVNTGFQTANTAFLQYAAGNFQTQLSWILTQGRGKLVAAPMATTLNNVPVNFFSGQSVPIFLSTPIITQNGTAALAPQLSIAQAFTGLSILPRINGDGTITLFGTVFVTDLGQPVTGPNGESAPTIITQQAPVQRIIRNGDTMVIGGLTRKNNNVSTNRVPLLGDLPLIGTLFRSRNVTTSDADLLVFITAQILPERPAGVAVPGVGGMSAPGEAGGGAGPGNVGGGVNP